MKNKLTAYWRVLTDGPQKSEGYYYTITLDQIKPQYLDAWEDLTFMTLSPQTVQMLLSFREQAAVDDLSVISQSGEGFCVAAVCDGRAVGHAACMFPENLYCGFHVKHSAYIYYCCVDEAYRGRGIYPRMLTYVMAEAHRRTQTNRFSISTALDNLSSQRGIEKVGFQTKTRYTSWEWWKLRWKKVTL